MAEKSRSIFEDVNEQAPKAAPKKIRDDNPKSVRIWLWILFVMVFAMVLVGGLTRLTDSGLSITEWDLLRGVLPPMNAMQWQELFGKYQTTTEFQTINAAMSIDQFKNIFWWEWCHRFLGRMIGAVWIIGFLWFVLRKSIRRDRLRSILLIGIMIGVQGAIGWWMVRSGLEVGQVDVRSYRLATHLGLAFLILGLIYWNVKMLGKSPAELVEARRRGASSKARFAKWIAGFVFLQIILGAMVAGIDAGMQYTDWPMMGGQFFPSDALDYVDGSVLNALESAGLMQFLHRMNGYLVALLALILVIREWRAPYKQWRILSKMFLFAVLLQIAIGVGVLMRQVAIPEALTHQAMAMGIWILALGVVFAFTYPRVQKIAS